MPQGSEGAGRKLMTGLELVAGYLVAWACGSSSGRGSGSTRRVMRSSTPGWTGCTTPSLTGLGTDSSLAKLAADVSQGAEPSERTLRRVQDALEEAAEGDPDFAAVIGDLITRLQDRE
jgi:hypothetical protein